MKNSCFFWWISFLMLSSLGTCLQDISTLNNETHDQDATCEKMEEYKWQSAFHDCFVDRKYNDGGRDLNNIIHRILKHADACAVISRRRCRLDYGGFKFVMSKVIEQMKDYSIMYMEAIMKGRESVKDLECVEDVLTLHTYVECFKSRVPDASMGEKVMKKMVEEGLTCANEQNRGCSNEALTTFNRIVMTLLGINLPSSESSGSTPTTPAVSKEESTPTNRHTEESTPTNKHTEESTTNRHMEESSSTNRHMEVSTPTNRRMEETTPTNRHMEESTTTNRHMEESTSSNRHMEESTTTTRNVVQKVEPASTTRPRVQKIRRIPTTRHRVQEEDHAPTHLHSVQKEEPTQEPPMRWYDYIFKPFIAAWNFVKSIFG